MEVSSHASLSTRVQAQHARQLSDLSHPSATHGSLFLAVNMSGCESLIVRMVSAYALLQIAQPPEGQLHTSGTKSFTAEQSRAGTHSRQMTSRAGKDSAGGEAAW